MQTGSRLRRWMLAASLAANVLLGLAAFGRPVPQPDDEGRIGAVGFDEPPVVDYRNATAAAEALVADDAFAARLVQLRALEQVAQAEVAAVAAEYWRSDGSYEIEFGRALLDARDRVRAELLGRYGPDARDDPAFARLFRPLDPAHAFLSTEQQLALERLRFERERRLGEAMQDRPAGEASEAARPVEEWYQRELAALLDEANRFELELRDSALARRLRDSGVGFSEAEFRASFRILAALEAGAGGIDGVLAAREALSDLLGSRRSASLWSARDPAATRIAAIATAAGVAATALPLVHEVLDGFQQQRLELARSASANPARTAEATRALAEQERAALAAIVGDDTAATILRERAVESYRVFRGASRRE